MATIEYFNTRIWKKILAFDQSEAKATLAEFCFWKKMDKQLKKWESILQVGTLPQEFLIEAKKILSINR